MYGMVYGAYSICIWWHGLLCDMQVRGVLFIYGTGAVMFGVYAIVISL